MGPKAGIWVFLLLFGIVINAFPQQFIMTDAKEGFFSTDQKLTFDITGSGWLKLLLDNREIYRGRGPAFPELGLPKGEERNFYLAAEYYSSQGDLLERRSWNIFIDKKAPILTDMEFRNTRGGLRLKTDIGDQNAKIRAWADIDGSLVFFPDLEEANPPPSDSFSAFVWAEDFAGNYSQPRHEFFEISNFNMVKIENPVPGEWLNPQTLVISGAEGLNIYWTIDGSNPLESGSASRRYIGPERIEKSGRITLRIAWRDSQGRIMEDRIIYSVAEGGGRVPGLEPLFRAEEKVISSVTTLPVPGAWLWSMGGNPRVQDSENITLRPELLIKRAAILHLLPEGKSASGGFYRFVYFLDKGGNGTQRGTPALLSAISSLTGIPVTESVLHPQGLRLLAAGRSRLVIWPAMQGTVYYSWSNEPSRAGDAAEGPASNRSWQNGNTPLPVPLEGGILSWFVIDKESMDEGRKDAAFAGPFSVNIAPILSRKETSKGRFAIRNYSENGNERWEFVSALLDYTIGMLQENPGGLYDVCDGEDLEWAFISVGGNILEQQRRDRLPPSAPRIVTSFDNGWTRGPANLSVISDEKDASALISARLRYASGITGMLSGTGSLVIDSYPEELAEVTVEGLLVDASGNRSPKTILHFTLDPKTVYVSSDPLMPGTSNAGGRNSARGGMDNPFTSLEEALDYALKNNLSDIRIAGTQVLRKPVIVSGNLRIDGGWRQQTSGSVKSAAKPNTGATVVLGDGFSWKVDPGASLNLSGISFERKNGNNPLILAGKNTRVEISGAAFTNTGPLLDIESGVCVIKDSLFMIKIQGDRRIAGLSARESSIEFNDSSVLLEGDYSLLFDLLGGGFSSKGSVFNAKGARTATLLSFDKSRMNLTGFTMEAAGRDYASALEASYSELVMTGGSMRVSARDTCAILLDYSPSAVLDTAFRVEGSFSARAAEVHGPFPMVQNSTFYSIGTAPRAEVFAGGEGQPYHASSANTAARAAPGSRPEALSITGNLFSGFTHIWGGAWPIEHLTGFNQAFASPDRPNRKTP